MKNYLLVILFAGIMAYACVADISEDADAQLPGQEEVARSTDFWTDLQNLTTGTYPSTEFPGSIQEVVWHKAMYATAVGRALTAGNNPAWDVYSGLYFGWHVLCEEMGKIYPSSRSTESLTPEQAEAMVREAIAADPEQFALLAEELRQAVNIDYINGPSDLYKFGFNLIGSSQSLIQSMISPFSMANTPKDVRRTVIFQLMNMSGLPGPLNTGTVIAEMNEGELFLEEALDYLWNNNWQILKPLREEFAFMDGIMYLRHYSQYSGLLYDLSRVLEYVLPVLPRTAQSMALEGPFRGRICPTYWDSGEFTREDFSTIMMSVYNSIVMAPYLYPTILSTTPTAGSTVSLTNQQGINMIFVTGNTSWTATATDFVTITSGASGTGDGTVRISYPKNMSYNARTASVMVREVPPSGTGIPKSRTINFRQNGNPEFCMVAYFDNESREAEVLVDKAANKVTGVTIRVPASGGTCFMYVYPWQETDRWSFLVPANEVGPFYSFTSDRSGTGDGSILMGFSANTYNVQRSCRMQMYINGQLCNVTVIQDAR